MSEKNVLAGRYELIEKIGDGGMAIVYKAKDRLLKRLIAVKILKPEFVQDAKFVENFRRESHAAASLSHPNIVSIYDVGQEGNVNYIVMELVNGRTLNELIREDAPMSHVRATEIAKQVASGLAAAHKKGIIHRDVKPHNILMTEEGVAKITDFGIAKAVSNTTIVDATKENVMGSVHYFSPEQAKGAQVNEKSDIYSLGIVLYEMLTGRVPFDGDNPVTVALMQINEPPTSPSVYNHNIPPALERIVMKAIRKNPSERFESADDFIEAIDNMGVVERVVGSAVYTTAFDEDGAQDYLQAEQEERELRNQILNTPAKKTKSKKKKMIIIIVAALVLALALGLAFALGLFNKKDIEVPDFKGMTVEEAEDKADSLNIKIKIGEYEYSEDYEQDEIMSQDPEDGTMVAKDTVITVNVSKGAETGAVPNLIGKTESEAKTMIKEYGFKVGTVTEEEGTEEKGTVIAQDPKAGEEAKQGDTINITISDGKGKEMGTIPDLLGMGESEAREAIKSAGFEVGTVKTVSSPADSKGIVIRQNYNPNLSIQKGTKINIEVGDGSQKIDDGDSNNSGD